MEGHSLLMLPGRENKRNKKQEAGHPGGEEGGNLAIQGCGGGPELKKLPPPPRLTPQRPRTAHTHRAREACCPLLLVE